MLSCCTHGFRTQTHRPTQEHWTRGLGSGAHSNTVTAEHVMAMGWDGRVLTWTCCTSCEHPRVIYPDPDM
eukprot:4899213-Prorocentrum_lima.AAC.1